MTKSNPLTPAQGSRQRNHKMRAIVQTEYGSTDMLSLQEVDKPILSDNGVLVRVCAAAVHAGEIGRAHV